MTTYATITFTTDQAKNIVARWNEFANDENQLTADQAFLLLGDNADSDMQDHGQTLVEIGRFKSRDGNPATFWITADDVTLELHELDE